MQAEKDNMRGERTHGAKIFITVRQQANAFCVNNSSDPK